MTAPWPALLQQLLPTITKLDPDVVASFSHDQAPLAPAGTASALVRARMAEDVTAVLAFANARDIPVVTRGAGTGLAGGANAVDGCIVLSVAAMNRIVKIDPGTRTAVVEPGVLNADLVREANALGLHYAPDPASREISTLGGNIATNAGGSCCLKYGDTGDHVASLKVALADGTIIDTGKITDKNVAGLDLTRLFVGSEGTLGVVLEATVRLLRKPLPPSTLVAFFSTVEAAARAIVAMDAQHDLSLLEVMDNTTLRAVDAMTRMDLDLDAAAFVLVQSDSSFADATMAACEAICEAHAARTVLRSSDAEESKHLVMARRMALPALEKLGTTLLDDVAVPKPALPEMFARIAEIGARQNVVIGTFGHAGDGNLHPTIVFRHDDEASKSAALRAFDEILEAAMSLGGTIAGEHGIGSLKQRYMTRMVGVREQQLMRGIKAVFDPRGIMNPGKGM